MSSNRQLHRTEFYCDGHYTVLCSASRGGMAISDEDLAEELAAEPDALIAAGVVMPLVFQGDCALGQVVVLAGGGDPYDWENAVDEDPDDDTVFAWIEVPPGEYLVELYAFASSMTAAHHFEEGEFSEWFARTRPGIEQNEYVKAAQ